MIGDIRTGCRWEHFVEGLKKIDIMQGIISERDTVKEVIFTTPDGEAIEVPEGSTLGLVIGPKFDTYAIGIEHEPGSFGMTHGPTRYLGEMLSVSPPDSRAFIFFFGKDGSERKTHKVDASGTYWESIEYNLDDMIIDALAIEVPCP